MDRTLTDQRSDSASDAMGAGTAPTVLVLTNDYPTDANPGDAPCILDQVEALRDLGVRVKVHHIDRVLSKTPYLQAALRLLGHNVSRRRFDLVHAFYGHCGLIGALQRRAPVVVTYRGSDLLGKDARIGRLAARWADAAIVMSDQMARVLGRSDADVIPFGVNRDLFRPTDREAARKRLGIGLEEEIGLFPYDPGRIEKRFWLAEAAVQRCRARGTRVRLVTVHGRNHREIADFMNAADFMLLTSRYEGSPMAVREALCCGLPVVSLDVGDVADLIRGIGSCRVVSDDPEEIGAALEEVLRSGERVDSSDLEGVRDVKETAREVLEVYRTVLSSQGSRVPR